MDNFDLEKYISDQTKPLTTDHDVDLGDWSVCDHVCGGGLQHKWRKIGCKPPMIGHACNSNNTLPKKLTRACNNDVCSENQNKENVDINQNQDDSWKYAQPTITLPPKLDARFVSHRFQQYEECKIKDEDLCIRRADLGFKLGMIRAPILPGRAVLNTHTFSF